MTDIAPHTSSLRLRRRRSTPFLAHLDRLIETIVRLIPLAVLESEKKAVHQARVATRRMTAALELLEPVLSKRPRKAMAKILKKLRRRLGPLRDLDVSIALLANLSQAPGGPAAAAWIGKHL